MRKIFLILTLLLSAAAYAQQRNYTNYTIREALPSNYCYKTIQDNKGFLWIATDNGLARFDGRQFRTYTTRDGLPDNEVIDIFIDSSHTIWVVPFLKRPAYYNPQKDRFENENTSAELRKVEVLSENKGHPMAISGVVFFNVYRNAYWYRNGKMEALAVAPIKKNIRLARIIQLPDGSLAFLYMDSIRYYSPSGAYSAQPNPADASRSEYLNGRLYTARGRSISIYGIQQGEPLTLLKKEDLTFDIRLMNFAGRDLAVISRNGKAYLLDTSSLQVKEYIDENMIINHLLQGTGDNLWMSTKENGLMRRQQAVIFNLNSQPGLQQNMNTLWVGGNTLICGNNLGEVYIKKGLSEFILGGATQKPGLYDVTRKNLFTDPNVDGNIRRIIPITNGWLVGAHPGVFEIDKKTLSLTKTETGNGSIKSLVRLSDSLVVVGTHSTIYRLNPLTQKTSDTVVKRIATIAAGADGRVYAGAMDGLFLYQPPEIKKVKAANHPLNLRINALAVTPENLVWVGAASDTLLVLNESQVIAAIPIGGQIPGNVCKSLFAEKAGTVWLGTNKGICRINYRMEGGVFRHTLSSFYVSDGLSGEQVNDIFVYRDTVFAATSNGISYFPSALNISSADIPVFITRIRINDRDTTLESRFNLSYAQNNITVEFTGIDLAQGENRVYQYRINEGEWRNTIEQSIPLKELAPGNYKLDIRCLRRDGQPSPQVETVRISISTPFWRNTLFWVLLLTVLGSSLTWFLIRRQRIMQKAELEKLSTRQKLSELEMQALRAQINPHFVFNCLNSIKSLLYEKDIRAADNYLNKFSALLRATVDHSLQSQIPLELELDYLDNYLSLERLRMDDRFNFSMEIDGRVALQTTMVPPMLLQPFAENAIKHGIRYLKNKRGEIIISLKHEGDFVVCRIADNGIGMEASARLKSQLTDQNSTGQGMSISRRRCELSKIRMTVNDQTDQEGKVNGTVVELKIPSGG